MIIDLVKFFHLIAVLGLLGFTFDGMLSKHPHPWMNKILLGAIPVALITGSLLVLPKGFHFYTPWIKAAYLLFSLFIVGIAFLFFKKPSLSLWQNKIIYVLLGLILILISHDAVIKDTFLFSHSILLNVLPIHFVKMFHILSASIVFSALLMATFAYIEYIRGNMLSLIRIYQHTWRFIIPFGILQLVSGFTLASLQPALIQEKWFILSLIGLFIFLSTWLGFMIVLNQASHAFKRLPTLFFTLSLISVLMMIFLMSNKIK